jgi:predicted Ser/Thr protein kinase
LGEDYILLNEIARGGMGSVYRARQKSLNRIVAIKRPLPGVAADPERVRRFRTEAESVAALSHPNIIPVFESGEWNGEQFFSMAYVEGESLSEIVRRRPLTPVDAARYVKKIAQAIHHAHQRGVLHRDLKPANIIVDATDEPLVADFGIACLLRDNDDETADKIVGTANYMAPEQIQPGSKPLSVATDVYALGGILYHLLTGQPPFDGENREQIYWSAYYEEPVLPTKLNPKIPRDLEAICLRALEKHPDHRYPSAQAMAEDLIRFEQGRPVTARPVSWPTRCWMWTRRNPYSALLLASLAAAVTVGIVAQMLAIQRIRSARAASEGFIGFMNQDLADDLRDVGRLDLMEKINARAEDYYTNYTALGDSGYLERKARFFENTAAVEKDLGHLARAEACAAEAERIYERQHQLAPNESRWKQRLSRVHVLRLNIAKAGGVRPAANAHGEAALLAANEALALNPDATNKANLGQVLLAQIDIWVLQNRADVAATNIATAESLLQEATRWPGADPEWHLDLANCAYYRARISQIRGAHDIALEKFTDYLASMEALAARYPRNNRWQYELAVANAQVAAALTRLQQNFQAQPYIDAFERLARNLTSLDPRNTAWLSLYGKSLVWQGVSEDPFAPKGPAALNYLNMALTVQSNLLAQNPDWEQWAENAAETTKALIGLHLREGRRREASDYSANWLRQCEERARNAPDHVGHQLRWGAAIVSDIRLKRQEDGAAGQIERLRKALEKFTHVQKDKPGILARARVLAGLADALENGGDIASAVVQLQQALDLRLAFFAVAPQSARLREQIPNTFLWMVTYKLQAGPVEGAIATAEEGINWASRNLSPEEGRRDYAELCLRLTQGVPASSPKLASVRQLVDRYVSRHLQEPPALVNEEETYAAKLRDWMSQHP